MPTGTTPLDLRGADRYRMLDEIGRGGIGVVRAAEDQALRRELAIKTLHSADNPAARARFIEEAQITGQLQHPNIVPVHELGLDAQQRPYMAMKRVIGRTMRELIREAHRRARISDSEANRQLRRLLDVFLKACDAVAFAHDRGVIHRDLKPENIMVGEFGEVLVVDWGLARPIGDGPPSEYDVPDAPSATSSRGLPNRRGTSTRVTSDRRGGGTQGASQSPLTMDGAIVGTLSYMPPEQAAGMINALDEGADIYALGGILYCILTDSAPFDPDDPELMVNVVDNRLEPPRERAPDAFVPRELQAVVLKAMARRRRMRYHRVSELREDIERWLDGQTIGAADYTTWQRLIKWAGRHRTAVLGGASTLAVAVVGVIIAILLSAEAATQRVRAEAERNEAQLRELAQNGQLDALKAKLGVGLTFQRDAAIDAFNKRWEEAKAAGQTQEQFFGEFTPREVQDYIARFQALLDASATYGRQFHTATDTFYLGLLCAIGTHEHQKAIDWYTKTIELEPTHDKAWNNRALERIATGDLKGAIDDLTRLIELQPGDALAWSNRAAAYSRDNQLQRALADIDHALSLDRQSAGAWLNRAVVKHALKDDAGALADLTESLRLDPAVPSAWFQRAMIHKDAGNLAAAVDDFTQCIAHPARDVDNVIPVARFERGKLRRRQGDVAGAIDDFTRALEREPAADPLIARALIWRQLGFADATIADMEAAEALLKAPNPTMTEDIGVMHVERGSKRAESGDLRGAIADFGEAIRRLATRPELLADAYRLRAQALMESQDNTAALADATEAVRRDAQSPEALQIRGVLYGRLGQFGNARSDFEAALRIDPTDWQIHRNLAVTLMELRDYPAAIRAATGARDRAPDEATRASMDRLIAELQQRQR
ncbi:MAG: tetratricopeptide repeat protein [Planctomycetota bacterium]